MPRVHSHYDNLKVARNAPTEVIRAAYRALAQRHHPDVNSSPDSVRVMTILNEAWDVLGDPLKRAAHDAWIATEEQAGDATVSAPPGPGAVPESQPNYTYTYTTKARPQPKSTRAQTGSAPTYGTKAKPFSESDWVREATARDPGHAGTGKTSEPPSSNAQRAALGVGLLVH
jgi:DnaJ-class molecular chaperone